MCSFLILLSFLTFSSAYFEYGVDEEQNVINLISAQGEFSTREQLKREIGDFEEPSKFVHRNYTELTKYIYELNDKYPNLTHVYSAGATVRGRQLFVLVVSKYAKEHRKGIPEFKYVANMHGNEVTGRVFCISMAETLLMNYEKNLWMRKLVDSTRIHLMPSMNPDGYEYALESDPRHYIGRFNANGKDLNRNFPSRYPNFFPTDVIQPETIAVMNWTRQIPFVLSANLHGGTTLVNYPFDDYPSRKRTSHYTPTPDNALFIRLAYSYARAHERMWKPGPRCLDSDLTSATDPKKGIINGAQWYIVSGGMQDWNYLNTNCFELTIEMNCEKFPKAEQLKELWEENKYSLFYYISLVHGAIHGVIEDVDTGEPVQNATVSIDSKSKIVVSYGEGEFWRLANLGTYEVTFDHNDYIPYTRTVTITPENRSPNLEVKLEKLPHLRRTTTTSTTPATTLGRASRIINETLSNTIARLQQEDEPASSPSLIFQFLLLLLPILFV